MTWSQPWRCIPRSLKQWKLQVTQSTRAVRYLANSRNSSSCNPHSTTVVSFVQTVTQTQRRDLASVKILCTCCKTQRISNRRMPVLSNIFKPFSRIQTKFQRRYLINSASISPKAKQSNSPSSSGISICSIGSITPFKLNIVANQLVIN